MAKKPGERDYRDLRNPNEKRKSERNGGEPKRRWWDLKGEDCAEAIASNVNFLMKHQTARLRQNAISARLYGNVPMFGAAGITYARLLQQQQTATKERVTYNATQSIVDTVASRIGENKPRPYNLTSGGNYKQQRRAKRLNQYIEGVFYETKTYDLGLQAFRDAEIWGDGFIHVFNRNGKTHHERVLSSELWVDEVEAQYDNPRNLTRLKMVDRDELAAAIPEARRAIMESTPSSDVASLIGPNIADMVTVAESWHRGTKDEDGNVSGGFHAMALTSGEILVEPEEWPFDFFPFARISWSKRPVGYWSQGLCEQLQGEQIELNKELYLIQRSMHLAGSLKIFLKNGSKVSKEALNNDIGSIVNYSGDKPEYFCPQPIDPVYFQNTNTIIERMYRKAGVSEMSAASKKPAGLNSGAAIREAQDVESDRHRTTQRANDQFYLDIAALDIAMAGELPAGNKVRVPNKVGFDVVDFKKDIGTLKDSEFVMQCFPVSKLPRDPAGRLATIQEYIQAGFITPRQGRRALDFADLDSIESLANAQEDMICKVLDAMVDDGEYSPPEPTDDLQLASEMVIEYIQRYRALDLEEEKLELLRTFNVQIQMLMDRAAAAAMPPPSAPGAPDAANPQAVAAPPPVSQLLPNAPAA